MENWRKQAPSRAEEGQPFEPVFHCGTQTLRHIFICR